MRPGQCWEGPGRQALEATPKDGNVPLPRWPEAGWHREPVLLLQPAPWLQGPPSTQPALRGPRALSRTSFPEGKAGLTPPPPTPTTRGPLQTPTPGLLQTEQETLRKEGDTARRGARKEQVPQPVGSLHQEGDRAPRHHQRRQVSWASLGGAPRGGECPVGLTPHSPRGGAHTAGKDGVDRSHTDRCGDPAPDDSGVYQAHTARRRQRWNQGPGLCGPLLVSSPGPTGVATRPRGLVQNRAGRGGVWEARGQAGLWASPGAAPVCLGGISPPTAGQTPTSTQGLGKRGRGESESVTPTRTTPPRTRRLPQSSQAETGMPVKQL